MIKRRVVGTAVLFSVVASVSACGGSEPDTPTPTITRTVFVTQEPTDGVQPPTEDLDDGDTPTGSGSTTESPSAQPAGPPVITGDETFTRRLWFDDVFDTTGWDQGEVEVAGMDKPVQGAIFTSFAGYCSSSTDASLELRFNNQQGLLTFKVGQALNSAESDVAIEYRLFANGRLVETQKVLFAEMKTLSVDLTGVSAVIFEADPVRGESSRSCSTTAVIADISLDPSRA